jgi:hypothetical protein
VLDAFRDAARQRGIPSAEVERWIADTARPCAIVSVYGDGPVVGRFGGPLMLPAAEADPGFPLVASIDCAAIPSDATDLPLPADGHLLLFGYLEGPSNGGGGSVAYVHIKSSEPPYRKPLPEHPRSAELAEAWQSAKRYIRGSLQIGGYADDEYAGDWVPLLATCTDDSEGWVLLADWYADIEDREGAVIHWGIRRRDLAARRFDDVDSKVFRAP